MAAKVSLIVFLALVALAVVQHAEGRSVSVLLSDSPIEIDATWSDFQKRHVLEPVGADGSYTSWNRARWNDFLRGRITDYGTKNVNSFVISTPDAIRNDLASATKCHSDAANLYWSTRTFSIYVMNRVGTSYDAYNCGRLFFLAGLDSGKLPVHYHAQSTSQPASGSLPLNLGACTKIN